MVVENFPAGQSTQNRNDHAPGVVEYLPAGHLWHCWLEMEPFTDEYVPLRQFSQAFSLSAPNNPENLPHKHLVHVSTEDAPVFVE